MASTWTIQDKDGKQLGEVNAMSAKIAFILYMSDKGKSLSLKDVKTEAMPDGRTQVTHRGKVHFLKKG